ncbi:MAG: hypothetical protein ABSE19_09195 [Candidatus Acidiferrum sp.]|jgi:hypothetical protein
MTRNEFYEAMRDGGRLVYAGDPHHSKHEILVHPSTAKAEFVPREIRRTKNFILFTSGYYIRYGNGTDDVYLNLEENGTCKVSPVPGR